MWGNVESICQKLDWFLISSLKKIFKWPLYFPETFKPDLPPKHLGLIKRLLSTIPKKNRTEKFPKSPGGFLPSFGNFPEDSRHFGPFLGSFWGICEVYFFWAFEANSTMASPCYLRGLFVGFLKEVQCEHLSSCQPLRFWSETWLKRVGPGRWCGVGLCACVLLGLENATTAWSKSETEYLVT